MPAGLRNRAVQVGDGSDAALCGAASRRRRHPQPQLRGPLAVAADAGAAAGRGDHAADHHPGTGSGRRRCAARRAWARRRARRRVRRPLRRGEGLRRATRSDARRRRGGARSAFRVRRRDRRRLRGAVRALPPGVERDGRGGDAPHGRAAPRPPAPRRLLRAVRRVRAAVAQRLLRRRAGRGVAVWHPARQHRHPRRERRRADDRHGTARVAARPSRARRRHRRRADDAPATPGPSRGARAVRPRGVGRRLRRVARVSGRGRERTRQLDGCCATRPTWRSGVACHGCWSSSISTVASACSTAAPAWVCSRWSSAHAQREDRRPR